MGLQEKFSNIFLFVNDLIAINGGNDFENHYNEIYQPKLILKKENNSLTETNFLELHLYVNEGQIQTSLYDKRSFCNFKIVIKNIFCNY